MGHAGGPRNCGPVGQVGDRVLYPFLCIARGCRHVSGANRHLLGRRSVSLANYHLLGPPAVRPSLPFK
jgi:hypothetical protein